MSNIKKLMMSSAAGGDALDVDDVFSTYLYKGNDASRGITNGLALGDSYVGTSTQFHGSDGYLSTSSSMSGATNSKTFTFSMWVKVPASAYSTFTQIYTARTSSNNQEIVSFIQSGGLFNLSFNNPAAFGNGIVRLWFPTSNIPQDTWTHILYSADTSNSSNRHLYINDTSVSPTYGQYNNYTVLFGDSNEYYVGAANSSFHNYYGHAAHIYNDTTYRDLSTTSNRRIFIDSNGGSTAPSSLSALNPFIYLPLTGDYSIGANIGTGGNFTSNGSPTIEQTGTRYEAGYGEGGLVWIKSRSSTREHSLYDTERGVEKLLKTNSNGQEQNTSGGLTAFNSDGFSLGTYADINGSAYGNFASWTFRKAPKFFDVVTYTGDGTTGRQISHNLAGEVGTLIIKKTSAAGSWIVYHRSLGTSKYMALESTSQALNFSAVNTVTSTYFVSDNQNASGATYVAYLFAHNDGDGGFGPDGDQDIIKCGSFTFPSSGDVEIDLGFEPQWVITKRVDGSGPWWIADNMRGWTAQLTGSTLSSQTGGNLQALFADTSSAEVEYEYGGLTSTGFKWASNFNAGTGNTKYIYIAIRRGSLFPPESASEVFQPNLADAGPAPASPPTWYAGFSPDFGIVTQGLSGNNTQFFVSRLTQGRIMYSDSTAAEFADTNWAEFDNMTGIGKLGVNTNDWLGSMWKRAPGFFDVVTISGNGGYTETSHNHNLGVVPEMIIGKQRTSGNHWWVYHKDISPDPIRLNNNYAAEDFGTVSRSFKPWTNSSSYAPTETTFNTYGAGFNESSSEKFICYLFASLAGISKVGSYTGNGSSQTINCGFSAGASFILVKRTDSTGDWYMHDAAQGIIAGNDPYVRLNTNNAQITTVDNVDPANSGFIVNQVSATNINVSGASYIFYAVA